jgi:DNA repair photolyase
MRTPVHYEEMTCKSALNRVQGMPFNWSLNPYKGCVHGCHYCYARRYHNYLDLNAGSDFSSIIFAKTNIVQVLRSELMRSSWKREEVGVGSATDPYQPIEGRYRLTRGCLEAFADHLTPVGLVTKGTMIYRDLDVLRSLADGPGCSVFFSITTLNEELWQRLEPGTPPPAKRLWAMEQLVKAGVHAGVLLSPVLPGITDDAANLEGVVRAAADHGARFLGTKILYLQTGTREHFLEFLDREYPHLMAEYQRLYPGPYLPKRFQVPIMKAVDELKIEHDLKNKTAPKPKILEQLPLI